MELFGDDSDAEEEKLQVNEEFAEAYEARKRKQALDKAKEQVHPHSRRCTAHCTLWRHWGVMLLPLEICPPLIGRLPT